MNRNANLLTSLTFNKLRSTIFLALIAVEPSFIFGQGTIQFGFEEFPVGTTPPFVIQDLSNERTPAVADSVTVSYIPPFEAQKYLIASGAISLKSPDGQMIQSYTLHFWMEASSRRFFLVDGRSVTLGQSRAWNTVQGTLSSPAQSLSLWAYNQDEFLPELFGIDAVEFVTVPEPQTFWLLTLGAAAIALRPRLKHPKVHR